MAIGKNNSESFPTPVEADAGFSLLDLVDPVRPSFNSMARLGGFDTKNEEELRLLTAPELTQYNKDRANARMKGIGEMLFILSDAFAGKDILGRSMERRQAKLKEEEIARQRQEALKRKELLQELSKDSRYTEMIKLSKAGLDPKLAIDSDEIKITDIISAQKDERKTFEATNKGVKNFQQLLDAAQAADGAASYALMIKFIKQLDDSVVRDSEVATFGGFQGALTNLKNQISKTSGEGFTPPVKADMINLAAQTANRLVNDYGVYKKGKEASYGAIGFDPNMVFAGLDFNLGGLDLTKKYTPSDFEFIELD